MKLKPTKEQKYDFINENLMELTVGKKQTIVMEDRVYEVKYRGLEHDVFLPVSKEVTIP
jgi:hypothetical protein